MADYTQPDSVEKRVRYFDGQFLKDQDFIDEQKYHIDRQRQLSQILQVSGIGLGLEVTHKAPDTAGVAAGTAVDPKGRLIVLAEPQEVSVAGNRDTAVNLYISYKEIESDKAQEGSEGNRRWHEQPQIQAVAEGGTAPQDAIKLAKLNIDKDGAITVDNTVSEYSGVKLSGNITAAGASLSGALSFDSSNGQKIKLYDQYYGIGVQPNTQYFRTGKHFAWYKGGSHNDSELNAGTGGTVQMVIKDGNVGIGAASASEKLEVSGNIKATGSITGTTLSAGGGSITAGSANINGNFTATGKVGIGAASATEKLEVSGNIKATGSITAAGASLTGALSFGSSHGQKINLYGTTHTIGMQGYTTYFRTNKNFAWYKGGSHNDGELNTGGGTVQMVIKDGNVGIGKESPGEKLEVAGNLMLRNTNQYTVALLFRTDDGTLSNTDYSTARIRTGWETNETSWGKNFIKFETGTSSDFTTAMTVKGDKVGIGTTTPSEKLEVAGNIKVTGVISFNSKPFKVVRYSNLGDDVAKNTNYKTSEWGAVIAGYKVSHNERATGGMYLYMQSSNGTWHIRADVIGFLETWEWIDVLFIKLSWIEFS